MKKVLAFTLVLVMLASVLVMPSFAASATAGTYVPPRGTSADNDVTCDIVNEAEYKALAEGPEGTYSYKNLGTNLGSTLTVPAGTNTFYSAQGDWNKNLLTDTQKTTLANINNGISAIGFKTLRRPLTTISDGYWMDPSISSNTKGAFEVMLEGNYYDVTGNTYTSAPNANTGNIYLSLITYNFGATKTVDYLALVDGNTNTSNDGNVSYIQAADIYVSNDGKNWTLASYWDLTTPKMEGNWTTFRDTNLFKTGLLGADANNKTNTTNRYVTMLDLHGVQAQYVRLGITVPCGSNTNKSNYYGANANDLNSNMNIRDILLIGGDAKETTPATLTGANYLGRQTTAVESGKFSTRYVATIDSLNYAKAGFKVKIHYFGADGALTAGNAKEIYATKAYKEIKQYGMDNAVAADGEWFILFTLQNLDVSAQASFIIEVTPFVEDAQGVKDYGDTCRETFIAGVNTASIIIPQ